MTIEQLTCLMLLLPFPAALAAPWLTRRLAHHAAWVLALVPLAILAQMARFLPEVKAGRVVTGGLDWVPSLGLRFSYLIDGLSLTFLMLISGIGVLILIYAGSYLKEHDHQGRFFAFILMFMGSMLGLVASDHVLLLFVFWEMTSITSFLLIGFDHEREAARRAAFQALVITGGGGLLLLAGLLLLWSVGGAGQLSMLAPLAAQVKASPLYLPILILLLGGAFTKSAQFPFHVWLPNAMEAPTPVSAYLHSATMVKAGIYLLMRLNPTLGNTVAWETILPVFGGATLALGAVLAIRQTDMKLMLAYTTVASLGLLVLLIGLGTPHAIEAAVLYLVAHALFKGSLFMIAGVIDHETGTRDLAALSGLRAAMPVTFACAVMAALSMAGLPPFAGFLAKEEVYAALVSPDPRVFILAGLAVCGNALMAAAALAVACLPFIGKVSPAAGRAHEAPAMLLAGPLVLAAAGLACGLWPAPLHAFLSSPMASAVAGSPRSLTITAMPHAGLPLTLSAITLAIGLVVLWALKSLRHNVATALHRTGTSFDRGFDQAVDGLLRFSFATTRQLQSGRLDTYMTVTFATVAAALVVTPLVFGEMPVAPVFPADIPQHELVIMAIAVVGLFTVVLSADRLTAIVSLGIQGFAVAMLFLLYGAPDLAFTQFMVETLAVVILALVMTRLHLATPDSRPWREAVPDAAIAAACGLGLALLLLAVTQGPFDDGLSDFFARYSRTLAHGANIVNVIIVDFRGTDTLGEIAVVMVAGLAILSLVRLRPVPARRMADNDPDAEEETP